jgi:isopenicillin N synthase-like dioxygenase
MTLRLVAFSHNPHAGAEIDHSLASLGFLQITDIGIDPGLLDAVFLASGAFFDGPEKAKRRSAYGSAQENFGYQGVMEENLDPQAPADLKQSFSMRNILAQPPADSRWPSAAFRDLMQRFYAQTLAAAHRLQACMAHTLGLEPDHFIQSHSGENVTLRLLHYPSTGLPAPQPGQMGAGAHTDYGFLTLLFQRDVGGLQVIDKAGAWIDVPPRADAVVVNSGDLLECWTNGRYKSTMHRVVPKIGDRARLSIAVFIDPDSDTLVEAVPSCVSAQNPARFAPITAGEHLQARLTASHMGRFDR